MTCPIKSEESGAIKILVVCADWCSVCRSYKVILNDLSGFDINWIDINDFESLTDEIEIETFPSVIIFDETDILFFGPIEPNKNSLTSLLSAVKTTPSKTTHPELALAIKTWLRE
jgi:hypothetical protein